MAGDMPAPFDKASDGKIAIVRFLSTGDFFQAYLPGVETQAAALGADLRAFDSRKTQRYRLIWLTSNHFRSGWNYHTAWPDRVCATQRSAVVRELKLLHLM